MKSRSPSGIFNILLQLLVLLNFVLSVVSTCSISGTHAYELGESLHLTCVGGDGKQLEWTLDNLPINNTHRTRKTQVGNSATLVTHHVKQEDAGTYRCHCDGGDSHDHHVVIFEAHLYAPTSVASCWVTIVLELTVEKNDLEHISVASVQCLTLVQGGSWNYTSVPGRRGERVIHWFAVGNSGEANHTCNFTVVYQPNGIPKTRNLTKTATGDASCSEQNTRFKCTSEEDKTAALSSGDTSRQSSAVSKAYGLHSPQPRSEMVLQLVVYCILSCSFIYRSHEW